MQASRLLDNHCSVETPEGIDFSQAMAGPVVRILAFLIDLGWRGLIYAALGMLAGFLGGFGLGLFLILTFLLEWFYPVFFEVFRQGQTPGKKTMGLRVVNEDFTPVGWGGSVIRNLLRTADFFPLFYVAGLLSMVLSRRFQRLGDLAAGTLVVHVDRQQAPRLDETIQPRMPQQALSRAERQGIISLTVRSRTISEPRQQELADLMAPVTGSTGSEGLARLRGMGAWLLGRK
ncbi:RDD family protein [Marinobacterium weihaiense]|uniref:RDD family protein n=1 Tax=Marinobacterium weihaiense TaxID=2851016 RepID=A0ABS6M7S8_9GAMM|nr:RDD family protein [Marinobacterium weihaiense]MBV0932333.1 RDD family protein [Marinobacterium weihaiense]